MVLPWELDILWIAQGHGADTSGQWQYYPFLERFVPPMMMSGMPPSLEVLSLGQFDVDPPADFNQLRSLSCTGHRKMRAVLDWASPQALNSYPTLFPRLASLFPILGLSLALLYMSGFCMSLE